MSGAMSYLVFIYRWQSRSVGYYRQNAWSACAIMQTQSTKTHKLTCRAKTIDLTKFRIHALSFKFFAGYDHTFDLVLSLSEIYKHLQRFCSIFLEKWHKNTKHVALQTEQPLQLAIQDRSMHTE